jgi:MFS family permease
MIAAETAVGVSTPVPNLRAAWWGVVAVFLVHGLVVSTWVSRIAGVKSALRLSDGALGIALFGSAIGSVTAIPICGWAASRYGSRRTVQWTAAGFASSLLALALAPNLPVLFAALFIYGAMAGANDVAINAQAVGVEKRLGAPTMSRFHAMFSLGGIIGAAAGGVLAASRVTPTFHFVTVAIVILAGVILTRPLMLDTHDRTQSSARISLRTPPRALMLLSAIGFCIFLSEGAIADWTAVYIKQVLKTGEGMAAAGYAAFSAAMTIFRLAGDTITARLGRAWTIRGGGIVAACGLALVVAADSPFTALAGFAAAGAGFSSIIPVVFAAGGRIRAVPEAVGVATVSGLGYLGFLVGPPLIGFVSEATSLRSGLLVVVILSAVAAVLVSAVEHSGNRRENPLADV